MAQAIPQQNITEVKRAIFLPRILFCRMDLFNATDLHFALGAGNFLQMFAALPKRKSIDAVRLADKMVAKGRH